jgi:hypothetical protein
VVRYSRFHRGRYAQRLMNPAEIVVHVVKRDGGHEIFDFLTESICEARKTPRLHSHCEILPLDVTGGDVLRAWLAANRRSLTADTFRRALARLSFRIVPVQLHEHRVIHVTTERSFHSIEVDSQAIGC